MGMKEILEAKRLKALEATEALEVQKDTEVLEAMGLTHGADPVEVKKEPAPAAKIISFAEKMALRRKEQAALSQTGKTSNEVDAEVKMRVANIAAQLNPPALTSEQEEAALSTDDSETAQAYTDIAIKLNSLSRTDGEMELKHAMADLKKALHKNPSAALLMLDSDIGQMVIYLTKMTQTELEIASEPKIRGKKPKSIPLTPEQAAAAWDEL